MKKIFTLLLIALFVPALSGAVEWNSCDEADHNCSGDCGAFIDTDNDGICDYSQPAPEDRLPPVEPVTIESDDTHDIITGKDLKTKTVQEIAELYGISAEKYAEELSKLIPVEVRITDSFQVLHDNFEMEPNVAKGIAASIKATGEADVDSYIDNTGTYEFSEKYMFIPIVTILIILYAISYTFSRKGKISIVNHRKLWNILLTITFIVSCGLGVLLVLKVNYGIVFPMYANMLKLHVEFGTAMTIVAIFHILWHLTYYKNILKFRQKEKDRTT